MPNVGRPSKDCHLCRSRRVKVQPTPFVHCDLGRPACQRCIKYGAECPGYRAPQDLIFRDDTFRAKGKRKRALDEALPQASKTTDSTHSHSPVLTSSESDVAPSLQPRPGEGASGRDSSCQISPRSSTSGVHLPLGQSINVHWTANSVSMVLHVYSALEFLQSAYRLVRDDSPLIWAAHLFSRTYVTNLQYPTSMSRQSRQESEQELGGYLGKVLSSVNSALKDPTGPFRNDVLATIWVLTNYELLAGSFTDFGPNNPWLMHTRGLYSILKSRGRRQFYVPLDRQGFWPAYNLVQIQALVTNSEMPPESSEWLDVIHQTLNENEKVNFYVAKFISRIARAQSHILDIITRRDSTAAVERYHNLIHEVADAACDINNALGSDLQSKPVDSYMLTMYWATLINVHNLVQFLINFLTHCESTNGALRPQLKLQWHYSLEIIRNSAQGILDSIPAVLGPMKTSSPVDMKVVFDAIKLIWPLTAICSVTATSSDQKQAAESTLIFIGREVGIRQALNTYNRRRDIALDVRRPRGFGQAGLAD
ncbi:hypothetical protein S7711_08068 [Stachybotrys chartarum IBT 7711]|uniref:Zn(2)-C6 fungal-type domain-containing protein n=1 Tax=Stachybotrys chartarum (strain CBS 109288 / IBT 7711) TaxID=1280523 RepID=A0A084AHL0_STACB|nr:hypothetical protein S7711_08068 [Stachybotrys chartarum IBT 7711]